MKTVTGQEHPDNHLKESKSQKKQVLKGTGFEYTFDTLGRVIGLKGVIDGSQFRQLMKARQDEKFREEEQICDNRRMRESTKVYSLGLAFFQEESDVIKAKQFYAAGHLVGHQFCKVISFANKGKPSPCDDPDNGTSVLLESTYLLLNICPSQKSSR